VDLASICLVGKAQIWFASYIVVKKSVDWHDFIMDVCGHFKEELGRKVVEDFNKLQQVGTIDDYLKNFEELRSLMLQRILTRHETFFVDSFAGGLKSP